MSDDERSNGGKENHDKMIVTKGFSVGIKRIPDHHQFLFSSHHYPHDPHVHPPLPTLSSSFLFGFLIQVPKCFSRHLCVLCSMEREGEI